MRLFAVPAWWYTRLREWLIERRRPVLEARFDLGERPITPAEVLAFARSDARGIHLVLDGNFGGGWATIEALRDALARAREAGKLITVEAGRFGTLHGWLKDNIYQHGSKFTASELSARVTGGPVRIEPDIQY